jgi:transposase
MRAGKSVTVSSAEARRLKALVKDRNAPQKHVWRAKIVLLTADGVGTNEIMRQTGKSKTCVWRWRHPRWTFHFTPTSASWLNSIEGFFATLTKRRLKRGVFCSVVNLQAAINRFLEEHNQQSKPFTWTADPDKIIAAVRRGHQVLASIH